MKTKTDLSNLIDKQQKYAQYMIDEITHIIKSFGKRDPGSEGEKVACEYMADVLKNDCGCDRIQIEHFKENPGSFFGWIYITMTLVLLSIPVFFFVSSLLSAIMIAFGFVICILQFGMYKKFVDKLFPEKTGTNVTAIKSCKGEVKRRIFFNGHPDAAWEWPLNYRFGGAVFEGHIIVSVVGALLYLVISIINMANNGIWGGVPSDSVLVKVGLVGLIFVPFMIGMYHMWNSKLVVDGANDNLTGCYMGIAILKALKDEGVELENTEVGVILTGSEEAGLRGSKAWCEAHKGEFQDVPTFIISYDTIYDPKYLMTNYRDLNGTVKADKDVSDLFMEAAAELNIPCQKGMVPPLGGATDSAAFAQAGFRATGITGLNHVLEDYYHTRRDTYDNMNADGLAGCYAASVKALEMFDNGAKQ